MCRTFFIIFFLVFISSGVFAQYPGCKYTFDFRGTDGKYVDTSNKSYVFTLDYSKNSGPTSIGICEDNKTWDLYKGDVNMSQTSLLIVKRLSGGEVIDSMIIKFPPTLSGGKDKFYRDLHVGTIKYKKGTRKIRLPRSDKDWDELKTVKLCPYPNNEVELFDISEFQK